MKNTLDTGLRGEQQAVEYLLSNGFEILHRNWRNGRYELDIVARRDGVLRIVEVKTRKADPLTRPEEAMTRTKFRSLCRAAEYYVSLYGVDTEVVFDFIGVEYHPDGTFSVRYIPEVMSSVW